MSHDSNPTSPTPPTSSSQTAVDPQVQAELAKEVQAAIDNHLRRDRKRRLIALCSVLSVLILVGLLGFLPTSDYVIESPGPTLNVNAKIEGKNEVVSVKNTNTLTTPLAMTTVSVQGCDDKGITYWQLIKSELTSSDAVVNRDNVCPKNISEKTVSQMNAAQMTGSQDSAVVAAWQLTKPDAKFTLTVEQAVTDSAKQAFNKGDKLVSIVDADSKSVQITSYKQLREVLEKMTPGKPIKLTVERGSATQEVSVVGAKPEDSSRKGAMLGITLNVNPPAGHEVTYAVERIGGPSAGMIFALDIAQRLEGKNYAGTTPVAGTGTIDLSGNVGAIGGIKQKMLGAKRDGYKVFLAPAGNCADVVGNEPKGMTVIPVSTLSEARTAMQRVAAGQAPATTCKAILQKQK